MSKPHLIVLLLFLFFSCSPYKPISPNADLQIEDCERMQAFVNEHWYKHKEKKLFRYHNIKSAEFEKQMNSTYKNCFFNLTADKIKLLFGEPNEEIPSESIVYNMSDECASNIGSCELLMIGFDPNTLKPLFIMNQ